MQGGPGPDRFTGGAGNDLAYGRGGDDILSGGPGDDWLVGGQGRDMLIGGPGNDEIYGGGGADRIRGGGGDDYIDGGPGMDIINGGPNDEIIVGGLGADTLTGGPGIDVFAITNIGKAVDRITDFEPGLDGDYINVFDLLRNTDDIADNFDRFFRVVENGADAVFQVDPNGSNTGYKDVTVLTGVSNIDQMLVSVEDQNVYVQLVPAS